jgi:hypothetical protein
MPIGTVQRPVALTMRSTVHGAGACKYMVATYNVLIRFTDAAAAHTTAGLSTIIGWRAGALGNHQGNTGWLAGLTAGDKYQDPANVSYFCWGSRLGKLHLLVLAQHFDWASARG